jgi:DNA repair exonuclease SbcCD ATPase subunit
MTDNTPPPPAPVVFEHIRAEAFRGFADPVDLDLNASAVIVHGPNGLGKTSFFDAVQWALLGELQRLRETRLRPSDEYIVNAYCRGRDARVDLRLRLRGEPVVITRSGNRTGSSLTWTSANGTLRGSEAEAMLARHFGGSDDLDLATSLHASGLLQQDAARAVLSAKPRDRFDTLSKMLGLGELADVEQWARNLTEQAGDELKKAEVAFAQAESQLTTLTARLEALRQHALSRPALADVTSRLSAMISREAFQLAAVPASRDDAAALNAFASHLATEAAAIAQNVRQLRIDQAALPVGGQGDLEELASERERALVTLNSAKASLASAEQELARLTAAQASLAKMASAVLPHIEGPACPVCGQHIEPDVLRARLREMEGSLSTSDVQANVRTYAIATEQAQAQLEQITNAQREAATLRALRDKWRRDTEQLEDRKQYLRSMVGPIRIESRASDIENEDEFDALSAAASSIAALARELVATWDAASSADESHTVTSQEQARAKVNAAAGQREQLARASTRAKTLFDAMRKARVEVVRREFARLGPLAQDIYSRLDPHPTFREIDLVSDMFRAAGTTTAQVSDSLLDVAADPMIVFSSAQANIAAISYLMALNLASTAAAPVLLLDDPLQAMDDVNVLGFSDLCRHVRSHRQLFVSTHEGRFAKLLERKLAPRAASDRTIALEFVGWDRHGPTIKPRDVPDQIDHLGRVFVE